MFLLFFSLGSSKFATFTFAPKHGAAKHSSRSSIKEKMNVQLSRTSLLLALSRGLLIQVSEKKSVYFTVLTSTEADRCRKKILRPKSLFRQVCYTELFRTTSDIWLEKLHADTHQTMTTV